MVFNVREPFQLPPGGSDDPRTVATAIRDAAVGLTGEVTLTANQASTLVSDARIDSDASCVTLTPLTANAAAEIGNGTLYITYGTRMFTLTHASSAQTDRSFRYVVST